VFPSWKRRPELAELEQVGYEVRPVGQTAVSVFMFGDEDVQRLFPQHFLLFRAMLRLDPARRPSAWEMLLRC